MEPRTLPLCPSPSPELLIPPTLASWASPADLGPGLGSQQQLQGVSQTGMMLSSRAQEPSPYLGGEHVQDAVHRPSQQQPADQEAGQDHVGEEGAEVHHLQGAGQRP